jgi:hypothetical protein
LGNTSWAIDEEDFQKKANDMTLKEGTRKMYKSFISRPISSCMVGESELLDF